MFCHSRPQSSSDDLIFATEQGPSEPNFSADFDDSIGDMLGGGAPEPATFPTRLQDCRIAYEKLETQSKAILEKLYESEVALRVAKCLLLSGCHKDLATFCCILCCTF
jgi:hypothetical protein